MNATLKRLPAPVRAWALAKAAYETVESVSFAEQRELIKQITADDPEPPELSDPGKSEWDVWYENWKAWSARNTPRWEAPINAVIAKHDLETLRKLERLAEQNMVDWAEDQIKSKYADRYEAVKSAFDAYRDGRLFGDMREKFLKIVFNTPTK